MLLIDSLIRLYKLRRMTKRLHSITDDDVIGRLLVKYDLWQMIHKEWSVSERARTRVAVLSPTIQELNDHLRKVHLAMLSTGKKRYISTLPAWWYGEKVSILVDKYFSIDNYYVSEVKALADTIQILKDINFEIKNRIDKSMADYYNTRLTKVLSDVDALLSEE